MLSRLADRLILCPTTDPIETGSLQRQLINAPVGEIEAWTTLSNPNAIPESKIDLIAIKFPGTGGRAENSGPHPFEVWQDRVTEVWTINHAGYGGSAGVASMQNMAGTCDAVWSHVARQYPDMPIWVVGNSLGSVSALYLAARQNVAGIYLRNPVPTQQLIATRPKYNWWSFGLAKHIARQIPAELDSIENASRSRCPALFVRSEFDRVIPAKYQHMIFDNYAGEKKEFVISGADHHHLVPETQTEAYLNFLNGSGIRETSLGG